MADQEFNVGAKVRLKSGGPAMAIDHIGQHTPDRRATCVWFEGAKQCQGVSALATLLHATDEDDPNIPAVGIARLHRG